MKTFFKTFLPLLFFIMLTSCATTSAGGNHIEKKQNQEKLLFEDWKYKGFGQELPVWLESAFENDVPAIKKVVPEIADKEVLIIRAEGVNSDQADKILKIKEEELSSDFILYDSSWALSGETYIALAVFYK
jgi:hypothetical protein